MLGCHAAVGLLALCLPLAAALSDGAPLGACSKMTPFHNGVSGQTGPSPHKLNVTRLNGSVQVTIMGPDYRGLLLQAKKPGDSVSFGNWSIPPSNTKTIACFNKENSAITHSNTNPKNRNVVYTWNPPPSKDCVKVEFVATVAQSREIYWVNLKSDEMEIACSGVMTIMSRFAVMVMWPLAWLAAF
ncbi:putative defense protein isoform X2 [Narcine bancroftii]|uniref:putative defense protein isoform X2 n=1 Tax=Narcine bancroftii TaxID=1343680 RepID=UPI0038311766